MHRSFKLSLFAAGVAAAIAVSAQPAPAPNAAAAPFNCPIQQQWAGKTGGMRRQPLTAEQRQAQMNNMVAQQAQALQITAAQRPQWDAYVQAKKNMFNAMSTRRNAMQGQDFTRMTADQRTDLHARHMETMAQHAREIANKTKALRDVLTPEQRTRFDQMPMAGARAQGRARGARRQWNNPAAAKSQPAAPVIKR